MANLRAHPTAFGGGTSQVFTTPFPHNPGEHAWDAQGCEYVFCKYITTNVGPGILVSIDSEHQAAPLLATDMLVCRVGIACQTATAGTNAGWVQIYGIAFAQAGGHAASTDATSICANGVSVSEGDAGGLWLVPQRIVTTPSGTLGIVAQETTGVTQVSLVTNWVGYGVQRIHGMWLLSQAQVSALADSIITAHWPNVTSPVSAVSNTSGPVTLTTKTSDHIGGEYVVFLNYPFLPGNKTS